MSVRMGFAFLISALSAAAGETSPGRYACDFVVQKINPIVEIHRESKSAPLIYDDEIHWVSYSPEFEYADSKVALSYHHTEMGGSGKYWGQVEFSHYDKATNKSLYTASLVQPKSVFHGSHRIENIETGVYCRFIPSP